MGRRVSEHNWQRVINRALKVSDLKAKLKLVLRMEGGRSVDEEMA